MVPLIAAAPVPRHVREWWLDRLIDAIEEDDPPYIEFLGEHWGALCADPGLTSHWADQLLPLVRHVLADRRSGTCVYSKSGTLCYSALFHAGRFDDLLAGLALDPKPHWHDQQWDAKALAAGGDVDGTVTLMEGLGSRHAPHMALSAVAEQLLLDAARIDEAYARYGIQATSANTNIATFRAIAKEPAVRKAAWRARLDSPAWRAAPNAGHRALVALERRGKLHALVTQNIDELHQRAGQSPVLVVEVHGSMRRVMCWQCGRRAPMEEALVRVRAGEDDPHCLACGGILKSDTISFGQSLVPEVIDRAMTVAAEADLLLAIGTTLQVQPVASMVPIAARAGADIVIVNDQQTAMDALAEVVIRAPIGEVLARICAALTPEAD